MKNRMFGVLFFCFCCFRIKYLHKLKIIFRLPLKIMRMLVKSTAFTQI